MPVIVGAHPELQYKFDGVNICVHNDMCEARGSTRRFQTAVNQAKLRLEE